MIELRAREQKGTPAPFVTLDLENAPAISLNLSVAKPGELMKRSSPYSQTFRLPFTDKNDRFFGSYYDANLVDGDFNPAQNTFAVIVEDGSDVIRGTLRLFSVNLLNRFYEVSVQGEAGDLFSTVGVKTLRNAFQEAGADVTSYNFVMNAANIKLSQAVTNDITNGSIGAGTVMVPFIDHGLIQSGQPIYADEVAVGGLFDNDISGQFLIRGGDFKPAIKLKAVLDRILSVAGFSYTSTFLSGSYFASLYMSLADHMERYARNASDDCRVGLYQNFLATGSTVGGEVAVYFGNETASDGFFDVGNLHNGLSYVAPQSGNVTVSFSIFVQGQGVDWGAGVLHTSVVSSGGQTGPSIVMPIPSSTSAVTQITGTGIVPNVQQGEAIQLRIWWGALQFPFAGSSTNYLQVLQSSGGVNSFIYFKGTEALEVECLVPRCMPPISQAAFLKDLAQRFNLVIEADPDNASRLLIEPYDAWIESGVTLDWSDKLDYNKERKIQPTTQLKTKTINLGDAPSKDVGNNYIQESGATTFGRYVQVIEDEFSQGELKNEPIFSPFHVYPIPNSYGDPNTDLPGYLAGRFYSLNDDGATKWVAQPPKLFCLQSLITLSSTIYIQGTSIIALAFCSPYNESPVTSTALSLYWQGTTPPFSMNSGLISQTSIGGYFYEYWRKYINSIYSPDSRIFEASFYLSASDIRTLRFNNRIFVEGSAYRLTEVKNYQAGTRETTQCVFLRDLGRETFGECTSYPTFPLFDGTMGFSDASGNPITDPGQICCESNGYTYQNNLCYWNPPDNDTGGGGGVGGGGGGGSDSTVGFDSGLTGGGGNPSGGGHPGVISVDDYDEAAEGTAAHLMNRLPLPANQTTRRVRNLSNGDIAVTDRFIMTGRTDGTTSIGAQSVGGGRVIMVDETTFAAFTIRATSVQVGKTGGTGTVGDQDFQEWTAIVRGSDQFTTITSQTQEKTPTTGTRTVSLSVASSGPQTGSVRVLIASDTGSDCEWELDVEMTRTVSISSFRTENAITTESGDPIITQDGLVIIKE